MGIIDRACEAILLVVKGVIRRCSGLSVESGECSNLPKTGVTASVIDRINLAEDRGLAFDGRP